MLVVQQREQVAEVEYVECTTWSRWSSSPRFVKVSGSFNTTGRTRSPWFPNTVVLVPRICSCSGPWSPPFWFPNTWAWAWAWIWALPLWLKKHLLLLLLARRFNRIGRRTGWLWSPPFWLENQVFASSATWATSPSPFWLKTHLLLSRLLNSSSAVTATATGFHWCIHRSLIVIRV